MPSRIRVGFLFNHRIHQILHAAPAAFELARRHASIAVTLIAANRENFRLLERVAAYYPDSRCRLVRPRVPLALRALHALLRHRRSIEKRAVLRYNLDRFAELTALVVPEITSVRIKQVLGAKAPQMVSVQHGAGDRELSSLERLREFDLVLLPGRKVRDRYRAMGHLREGHYEVVGYPKFDLIGTMPPSASVVFPDRSRPTVIYNPHFDPDVSSWGRFGLEVLEWFARSDRYNLIFAPHLMLFERKWKFGARLPRRYRHLGNVHVDTGSMASVDMSHTMAADVYLGDASSQVYEFLWKPRPCVFLDARGVSWRGDPRYAHWELGPVVTDVSRLGDTLAHAIETHDHFAAKQREAFGETFDLGAERSGARAADAIARFLGVTRSASAVS